MQRYCRPMRHELTLTATILNQAKFAILPHYAGHTTEIMIETCYLAFPNIEQTGKNVMVPG